MKVGHSGTQHVVTERQQVAFRTYVEVFLVPEMDRWGHGCCIGSDEFGDAFIRGIIPSPGIDFFPPTNQDKMFRYQVRPGDVVHDAASYLERNHKLVSWADYMIFTPSSMSENLRSGTWATWRYCNQLNKPYTIVWPDGSLGRGS